MMSSPFSPAARVEVVAPRYVDYTAMNSVYSFVPAMMADDRSLPSTARASSAERAQFISGQNRKITTNWEYRAELTLRGAEILDADFRNACAQAGYVSQPETDNTQRLAPTTDLKQLYMSRQELDAQRSVQSFSIPKH
jgi:hypothetical protein